jgi:uncharacterized lipoprotein YmbA
MRKMLIVAALGALAACASAPELSYHTLDMTPSGKADAGVNLEAGVMAVPEKLDRHQIVIQASPTRIEYYSKDRWAASVGEMVEHKLAAEFGPAVEGRRGLILSGEVLAFEQVDAASGPQGRVRLEIAIRDGGAKRFEAPLIERAYEATRPADGNTVDALVRALSRALEEIAAEIARDAAGLGDGQPS